MPKEHKFNAKEIAAYGKDHTWTESVAHFGCSRSTFSNACAANGVDVKSRYADRNKSIAKWVKDNNASSGEAMERFSVQRACVTVACNRYHVTPRPVDKGVVASRSSFEILAMLIRGYSITGVAKEFGVTKQRVHQIKKRGVYADLLGPGSIIKLKNRR